MYSQIQQFEYVRFGLVRTRQILFFCVSLLFLNVFHTDLSINNGHSHQLAPVFSEDVNGHSFGFYAQKAEANLVENFNDLVVENLNEGLGDIQIPIQTSYGWIPDVTNLRPSLAYSLGDLPPPSLT